MGRNSSGESETGYPRIGNAVLTFDPQVRSI